MVQDQPAPARRVAFGQTEPFSLHALFLTGEGVFVNSPGRCILPEGFVKIRHYGLLSNRGRQERIAQARALLPVSAAIVMPTPEASAESAHAAHEDRSAEKSCPHCGSTRLSLVDIYHKPQQIPTRCCPSRC